MARKKIDEAIRQKIIEAHAGGFPMRKIAGEYGVSLSSVHRIIKEIGPEKAQKEMTREKTGRQKRIEELEKKIAELEKKIFDLDA